jgi:PAS domain S-box-containing protein
MSGSRARLSLLHALAVALILLSVASAVAFKNKVLEDQQQLVREISVRNDLRAKQLAGAVSQQCSALITLFDMSLIQLVGAFLEGPPHFAAAVDIAIKAFPPGAVNFVAVTDAAGTIVYSSDGVGRGVNLGDRPHFLHHSESVTSVLSIGDPVESRVINGWAIPFSRAIRHNGRFVGIVLLSVNPDYLAQSLAGLALNSGDVVALLKADGTFLSRNHNLAGALGRKAPADRPFLDPTRSEAEPFRAQSSVDGLDLVFAWKRFHQGRLIAVVALNERGELQALEDAASAHALRANLVIAAILVFAAAIAGLLLWSEAQTRRLVKGSQRYRALMRSAGDGIHIIDENGNLVEASDSFYRMLGYDPDTPPALNVGDLDVVFRREDIQPAIRTLMSGQSTVFETRHRRADGSIFDVEVATMSISLSDGRYLYCSSRDITTRKVAEAERRKVELDLRATAARLSLVLGTTAEGVFGLDDENRIMFANAAAATALGWPSPEAVQGKPSSMVTGHVLADGTSCNETGCRIRSTLQTGLSHRVNDEFFTTQAGVVIPVEYVVSPLVVADMAVGAVVAFHDISARKALEEELRRSNSELEQFAYVASHDLRQPLRMISSYLALISKRLAGRLDQDEEQFITFAVSGAKRMDALIQGLLEYSRVGRTQQPERIALADVIAEALENLAFAIADADARIIVQPDFPSIVGDRLELMRLFQNLIGNAIKYRAADRAPMIEVGWSDGGAEWGISVQDNGIGIAEADRDRAFGIFQRLVAHDQYEGTGIGLAVCKKIVEQAGGRIWIDSHIGVGTTFHFTLPKTS